VLRRSLEESPEIERMKGLASCQPFRELLRTHRAHVLVGCALLAGTAGFNGLFFSHLPAYLTLLLSLAGMAAGFTRGSFAVLLTDLFPTRIRFTGVALVFNISFTIFSGTAPLIATTLIRDTGQQTSPALLMVGCAAIALLGSLWVGRYGGNVLAASTKR
jgi:hypothetical protein